VSKEKASQQRLEDDLPVLKFEFTAACRNAVEIPLPGQRGMNSKKEKIGILAFRQSDPVPPFSGTAGVS